MLSVSSVVNLPCPCPFEVGCEGEPIDAFPTAAEALRFARGWADLTACPYEILHAGRVLAIVDPLAVA